MYYIQFIPDSTVCQVFLWLFSTNLRENIESGLSTARHYIRLKAVDTPDWGKATVQLLTYG